MPPSIFKNRIRTALANQNLQGALDTNSENRIRARKSAAESLPEDLQVMRQRAHNLRSDVIANLDDYLDQFIKKVQSNGFIVHRAADAQEAVDLVIDIAQQKGAKLIAKSKTMVSEEMGLNDSLEAAGIKAVETDLGEYIVQLRGEHPSHIISPAVHLRRDQVGEIFHEKLGIPLTTDIPTLTNTARAALRQTFLNADIGITGVNVGVAETGSLCIVTNEGNARMVTTLPKTHIALMGIERLVPDMNGLALVLYLLPRSATGQKISVYTQLVHSPRRDGEIDGSEERHLILLDNGRSKLRGTPLNDILLCIRCGACLNACPVFREIGGHSYVGNQGQFTPYSGPIGSVLSPGLFGQKEFGHLAQASTLCGACKEACPVDIDLPTLLLRVRAKEDDSGNTDKPVRLGLRLFTWMSTSAWRFAAAQKLAGVFGGLLSPRSSWMRLPAMTGWGFSKDFPRPAGKTFRERWEERGIKGNKGIGLEKTTQVDEQLFKDQKSGKQPFSKNIDRFRDEFTALGGKFTACTQADLPKKISTLLQEKGISEVMAWESDQLPEGFVEELHNARIRLDHGSHPQIRAGITGVAAACAETGTIIITSGSGRPLSTSLLPEIHIAILRESDIYENLPQVFELREVQEAASVSLISGPSRTADIEMTLTIGVHGPGEIYVFCVS
jgi:L-lactate dehydrogenase complex protein LldF